MAYHPRPQVVLSAIGIGAFQVVGTFGAQQDHAGRALDALGIVLLLAGPTALTVRDRWPLVALGVTMAALDVYAVFGYAWGPIFVGVIVALYNAFQYGRRRDAWKVAGAGYAGLIVVSAVRLPGDVDSFLPVAMLAGWMVAVPFVSEAVRSRREQAAAERLRRAGEQRLHLAQELHDVLAHNIALINVQASVALHLLDEQPEQAKPALENIKAASGEALHELRTALDVLRRGEAAPRAPAPRLADLDALVNGVRAGGLDVTVTHDGVPPPLPAAVDLTAYRIVQEALTNVTRHARARTATVRLTYANGVTVEVTDDGVGGGATPGNGINGMRERAASLGGTLDAGPLPGGGFRVVATLPSAP